jgi:replicative DNA helicase
MIWRPVLSQHSEAPDDLAVLRVAKHRNGPLGRIELHFDTQRQRFRERTASDSALTPVSGDDAKMKEW